MSLEPDNSLAAAALAWGIAQSLKAILHFAFHKKFEVGRLISSGGMPSSHAALVVALTTSIGVSHGTSNPLFAACVIFSLIVLYDASGVRRAVGRQARILNQIMEDMARHEGVKEERLFELVGHTPFQVLAGAALGFIVALLLSPHR